MGWIETLEAGRVIVGLIVALTGLISGVGLYVRKRMADIATATNADIAAAQAETTAVQKAADLKIAALETDLRSLKIEMGQIDRDLRDTRHRVSSLDNAIGSLPKSDDIHQLNIVVTRMEGHVGRLDERLKPVAAIMERMQEMMMQRGKDNL